jgi:hypothetical protein
VTFGEHGRVAQADGSGTDDLVFFHLSGHFVDIVGVLFDDAHHLQGHLGDGPNGFDGLLNVFDSAGDDPLTCVFSASNPAG